MNYCTNYCDSKQLLAATPSRNPAYPMHCTFAFLQGWFWVQLTNGGSLLCPPLRSRGLVRIRCIQLNLRSHLRQIRKSRVISGVCTKSHQIRKFQHNKSQICTMGPKMITHTFIFGGNSCPIAQDICCTALPARNSFV